MRAVGVLLLFFVMTASHAQELYIQADASYATYSMSSIRNYQKTGFIFFSPNSFPIPIPLTKVSSFPSYWEYGFSSGMRITKKSFIGFSYNFNSTGGRSDYADYSGDEFLDILLTAKTYGIFYKRTISKSASWPISISLTASWTQTAMNESSRLDLPDQTYINSERFYSNNYGLRPVVMVQHYIFHGIYAQANIGYEYQIANRLHAADNHKAYLNNDTGQVKIDWSGLRAGVSIGYTFGKVFDH